MRRLKNLWFKHQIINADDNNKLLQKLHQYLSTEEINQIWINMAKHDHLFYIYDRNMVFDTNQEAVNQLMINQHVYQYANQILNDR